VDAADYSVGNFGHSHGTGHYQLHGHVESNPADEKSAGLLLVRAMMMAPLFRVCLIDFIIISFLGVIHLCLAFGEVEGGDALGLLVGDADGTEVLLVTHDVLLKGTEKALGMLGSEDDTTPYLGLGNTREHTGKVDNKVATGMGDNGKVSILALSHVLWQL
jgi:hypothetical protein